VLPEEAASISDNIRRADWMAHLVYVLAVQRRVDRIFDLGLKSLEILGKPFPMDSKSITKGIVKTLFQLYNMWKRTKGGRIPIAEKGAQVWYMPLGLVGHNRPNECKGANCWNCPKVRRVQSIVYRSLYMSAVASDGFPSKGIGLLAFKVCFIDIQTAAIDDGEFNLALQRASYGTFGKFPALSHIFLKRYQEIEQERNLGDRTHLTYYATSYLFFCMADFAKARKLANLSEM
jgi:hypothetical protein